MSNQKNKDKVYLVIGVLSALVIIFIFWSVYFRKTTPIAFEGLDFLPALNASLNALTFVLLIVGYLLIKKGQKRPHIVVMSGAVLTSTLFFISYIVYHYTHGDVKFTGQGLIRYVYFFVLISHIFLSIIQVPLIFTTLYHAFKKNYNLHKKVAYWTWPIWLYVSITGVLIYFFLHA